MDIMFIVYHDINTEARSQEILNCAQRLGNTYLVSYSKPYYNGKFKSLLTGNKKNYFTFVINSIKYIKKIKPDIIILHDFFTSIFIPWILLKKNRPFIIYDSSELYIDKKPNNFKERLALFFLVKIFEKHFLKFADIIISANIERAQIMKNFYKLKEMPIIFDNIHRIDDIYNEAECISKFDKYFNEDTFTILYAGGISKERMTYQLADSIGALGEKFGLIIIGSATNKELKEFNDFIKKKNYKNIKYLGFVSRAELKYLLNKAHVSVSAFSQNTVNNKFCASGKVYESLFEGTPILTSENPPLKRLCEDYGVGISTNDFKRGILELKNNYELYKKNVHNFILQINYDERINVLANKLQNKIKTIL